MYNTCTHKKPGVSLRGKAMNKPNNKTGNERARLELLHEILWNFQ